MAAFIMVKTLRFKQSDHNLNPITIKQPVSVVNQGDAPTILPASQLAEDMPELVEEGDQWMTFNGMDLLSERIGFTFSMRCSADKQVEILPIDIIAWHPGVFENGEFGIGKQLAVAWEHLGYEGLWIHSGWDFWLERSPATDLQYFLETNELNEVQPLKSLEAKLTECLLNSDVEVYTQEIAQQGRVTAAVRIPAGKVEELSRHTMDLVPYLSSTYPESGFGGLDPDALLIYFCGRAALDEITNPEADYWTQTRYIIAISPVE